MEEALSESPAVRRYVGVDLGIDPAPDETTVLWFRHLLENDLHPFSHPLITEVSSVRADK